MQKKPGYSKKGQPIKAGSQKGSGPKGKPKSSPKPAVKQKSMGKAKVGRMK